MASSRAKGNSAVREVLAILARHGWTADGPWYKPRFVGRIMPVPVDLLGCGDIIAVDRAGDLWLIQVDSAATGTSRHLPQIAACPAKNILEFQRTKKGARVVYRVYRKDRSRYGAWALDGSEAAWAWDLPERKKEV